MPKTKLRLASHRIAPGEYVVEIWWDGRFVGTVTGHADTAGVRILSKYPLETRVEPAVAGDPLAVVAVTIRAAPEK